MEGFCKVDTKLFGPLQLYVVPEMVLAVKFKVAPEQTGLLLPAVGDAGVVLTVTLYPAETLPTPQLLVPCTVIVPDEAPEEKLTVIKLLLLPEATVAPEGKVQV